MKFIIILFFIINTAVASEKEALTKINEFGTKLKTELQNGMKKSPIEAVKVCNIKAPDIANAVSQGKFKIGRVSKKNRNPQNIPQDWMYEYIEAYHSKKEKRSHVVVKLENGKMALLKPIQTMPLCLKCHGSKIDPTLYKEIKRLYPKDKAIGYNIGDIRGFFWAEY